MQTVVETQNLTKIYSSGNLSVKAVDKASIALGKGEFVALVGPSGSGKTTMLAMLAGLLKPTDGAINIDSQNLNRMNDIQRTSFRRDKIGFTFQANNLLPFLTALENVELMLRLNKKLNGDGRQRAIDLLSRLGLEGRLNNLPSQLSGGEQQRVAIARAVIHEPSLVLADEPTASLDTERAYQVVKIFADLIHEQNRTGIMVTHDLRMIQDVDRVIQMLDGKVVRVIDNQQEIAALAATGKRETNNEEADKNPFKAESISIPADGNFSAVSIA